MRDLMYRQLDFCISDYLLELDVVEDDLSKIHHKLVWSHKGLIVVTEFPGTCRLDNQYCLMLS